MKRLLIFSLICLASVVAFGQSDTASLFPDSLDQVGTGQILSVNNQALIQDSLTLLCESALPAIPAPITGAVIALIFAGVHRFFSLRKRKKALLTAKDRIEKYHGTSSEAAKVINKLVPFFILVFMLTGFSVSAQAYDVKKDSINAWKLRATKSGLDFNQYVGYSTVKGNTQGSSYLGLISGYSSTSASYLNFLYSTTVNQVSLLSAWDVRSTTGAVTGLYTDVQADLTTIKSNFLSWAGSNSKYILNMTYFFNSSVNKYVIVVTYK